MGLDIRLTNEFHKILREIPDTNGYMSALIDRICEINAEDETQFPCREAGWPRAAYRAGRESLPRPVIRISAAGLRQS